MKNYKVRPEIIKSLVIDVVESFSKWQRNLTGLPPSEREEVMHFMSDMIDDLISTAYPLDKKEMSTDGIGAESVKTTLNKGHGARAKATKDFGSPIDSVIFSKALSAAIENQAKKNRVSELDKQLEAVARVARNMKPPTPPKPIVDIHMGLIDTIFGGDK